MIENKLIKEIINVALGHYSYKNFGYSEAGGQIMLTNPSAIKSLGQEEYYSDYFSTSYQWVITYNDGASRYVFHTIYIDEKDYVNISDIGIALGFSFSMEKDDTNRIQLIKVAKL